MKDGDKDSGSAKSAISPGQITITNPAGQNQDLAALNHDTTNTNDEIKALPDLQAKLNEQLKTQQEWTQAAANMATAVKDAADFMCDNVAQDKKQKELWDEGGAARAALHAIAGGLLGGVNGVDAAIKSAIAAGVSTLIAPYINDIVKDAMAQSGLTGEDAKRMSDTLTSSIVLGLLAGAGGSSAAAYASNEIKYNFLKQDEYIRISKELRDLKQKLLECGGVAFCDSDTKDQIDRRVSELQAEAVELHFDNIDAALKSCTNDPGGKDCQQWRDEINKIDPEKQSYLIEANNKVSNSQASYLALQIVFKAYNEGRINNADLSERYDWAYNEAVNYQKERSDRILDAIVQGIFGPEGKVAINSIQKFSSWLLKAARNSRKINEGGINSTDSGEFVIAERVYRQLDDPRLGDLAGKLNAGDLQKLVNSPNATRVFDNRTGHINIIQEINGRFVRITVPRNEMKIISVGPIRPNQIQNLIKKGDFTPLK